MADFGWLWKRNKNASGDSSEDWRERLCFIRKGNLGYMSEKTGKPELICHLVDLHAVTRVSFPEAGHEHAFVLEFQPEVTFLPSGEKVMEPVEHICLSADEEPEATRWMRDIILSYTDIRAQRIFMRASYPAAKKANPLMTKPQIQHFLRQQYSELSAAARKRYASQVARVASPSRSGPDPCKLNPALETITFVIRLSLKPHLECPAAHSLQRTPYTLHPASYTLLLVVCLNPVPLLYPMP